MSSTPQPAPRFKPPGFFNGILCGLLAVVALNWLFSLAYEQGKEQAAEAGRRAMLTDHDRELQRLRVTIRELETKIEHRERLARATPLDATESWAKPKP